MTLLCPHCGKAAEPVLTPGPSPHVVQATCRHCGTKLKLLPKALVGR